MVGISCFTGWFCTSDKTIMDYLQDPACKVIDASPESAFWSCHVAGAINVPSGGLFSEQRNASASVIKAMSSRLPKSKIVPLVVYSDNFGSEAQRIVRALKKCGGYKYVVNAGPMHRVEKLKRKMKDRAQQEKLLGEKGAFEKEKQRMMAKMHAEHNRRFGEEGADGLEEEKKSSKSAQSVESRRLDAVRAATLDLRCEVEVPRHSQGSDGIVVSVNSGDKE